MYPLQRIRRLRALVIKYNLPRPAEFDTATDEQLQKEYNGIGSKKFRALLWLTTKLFAIFEAAALIHDYCWSKLWNDGTRYRWRKSNNFFRAGCMILAATCGVWFEWARPQQRAIYHSSGEALYRVVDSDLIGWPIWRDAEHCEEGPEVLA